MSGDALKLSKDALNKYLASLFGETAEVVGVWRLGGKKCAASGDLKGFGYGFPYVIEYKIGDSVKQAVLETMRPEGFGHDHFSDRAQILLWQHSAFNKLPKHVHSVDVGAFTERGKCLKSLGKCEEYFILTEFSDGKLYHNDLDRIKKTGTLDMLDEKRCLALSDYLVEIHKVKCNAPWLYVRQARELIGHGECMMGLIDSYPPELTAITDYHLIDVERDCVAWRWRLKKMTHRLSQVHGDFHPWNVLFRENSDFTVLDRSRGEWGEPANDVTALTINYIFYSVQKYGELGGVFERLFELFWRNYLEKTGDHEILKVVQPFYAWRGLVVASPVWYPSLERNVRTRLLNFVKNVLQYERFDLRHVNSYLDGN